MWKAPQNLQKTFTYEVTLIYDYQEQSESGGSGSNSRSSSDTTEPTDPPAPVRKTLVKNYTKTIVGNWSRWANKLRKYAYARP